MPSGTVLQSLPLPKELHSSRGLKRECASIKARLLDLGVATQQEIDAYWPGGASNKVQHTRGKWVYCYGEYKRFLGRRSSSETPAGRNIAANDPTILAALAEDPIPVRLSGSKPEDAPLLVYPKSWVALLELEALDVQMAWIQTRLEALRIEGTPSALAAYGKAQRTVGYTLALFAWIVTHPGPGLPYDLFDDDPAPPARYFELPQFDQLRIHAAHRKHLERLHALKEIIDDSLIRKDASGDKRQPSSWSLFWGSFDVEQVPRLMKHRAFASVMASVRLKNAATALPPKDDGEG